MSRKIDINIFPFGKLNSISKENIMEMVDIKSEEVFRKSLSAIRRKYIILSSSDKKGYWRPNTKQEYIDFIEEHGRRLEDTKNIIKIAEKEMKQYF